MSEPPEPYIHAGYFHDRDAADRCRAELAELGFRVGAIEAAEDGEPWGAWRVRAARVVDSEQWESENTQVGAVIARFGGYHDGGYWEFTPDGQEGWEDIQPPTA